MNPEHQHNNYEDKSGSEMLSEIGSLLWKLCKKALAHLLRLILKGLMFCFTLLKILLQACIDFWNDNSTQEKLRLARHWCANSLKALWFYTLMGIYAIGKGLVWTAKATWRGITHLKPTLIFLRKPPGEVSSCAEKPSASSSLSVSKPSDGSAATKASKVCLSTSRPICRNNSTAI